MAICSSHRDNLQNIYTDNTESLQANRTRYCMIKLIIAVTSMLCVWRYTILEMELNGQLQAPAALTSGKEPQYPLDKRIQRRCGSCKEVRNVLSLQRVEPRFLRLPVRSLSQY
jgi:hypothetical protein